MPYRRDIDALPETCCGTREFTHRHTKHVAAQQDSYRHTVGRETCDMPRNTKHVAAQQDSCMRHRNTLRHNRIHHTHTAPPCMPVLAAHHRDDVIRCRTTHLAHTLTKSVAAQQDSLRTMPVTRQAGQRIDACETCNCLRRNASRNSPHETRCDTTGFITSRGQETCLTVDVRGQETRNLLGDNRSQ